MQTNMHFWSYLAHFYLEREMFQTRVVEKIQTHFVFSNFFFKENYAVNETTWKNIVEPDRPQMKRWRRRFACWIPKATNTPTDYVILMFFHCNHGCKNAPRCYVVCTLSVL